MTVGTWCYGQGAESREGSEQTSPLLAPGSQCWKSSARLEAAGKTLQHEPKDNEEPGNWGFGCGELCHRSEANFWARMLKKSRGWDARNFSKAEQLWGLTSLDLFKHSWRMWPVAGMKPNIHTIPISKAPLNQTVLKKSGGQCQPEISHCLCCCMWTSQCWHLTGPSEAACKSRGHVQISTMSSSRIWRRPTQPGPSRSSWEKTWWNSGPRQIGLYIHRNWTRGTSPSGVFCVKKSRPCSFAKVHHQGTGPAIVSLHLKTLPLIQPLPRGHHCKKWRPHWIDGQQIVHHTPSITFQGYHNVQ